MLQARADFHRRAAGQILEADLEISDSNSDSAADYEYSGLRSDDVQGC